MLLFIALCADTTGRGKFCREQSKRPHGDKVTASPVQSDTYAHPFWGPVPSEMVRTRKNCRNLMIYYLTAGEAGCSVIVDDSLTSCSEENIPKERMPHRVRKTSRSLSIRLEHSPKLCSWPSYKLLYGVNALVSSVLVLPAVQTTMAQLWVASRNIAHLPKLWRWQLRFSCCVGSVYRLP